MVASTLALNSVLCLDIMLPLALISIGDCNKLFIGVLITIEPVTLLESIFLVSVVGLRTNPAVTFVAYFNKPPLFTGRE